MSAGEPQKNQEAPSNICLKEIMICSPYQCLTRLLSNTPPRF